MKRHWFCAGLVFIVAAAAASPAGAAPIVAGSTDLTGYAIQDITLLANTIFNPTNSDILIDDVTGFGTITINRSTQVGNTISIASLAGGQYYGFNAQLGSYVFGNIAPLTGADFSGSITNVVQDPTDPGFATGQASSFKSGDFTFGGASFGFEFLTGPAAGVKLFTDPTNPFQFSATFDGLPPSNGTVLKNSGPAVLDVLFNGVVVARSSDRRIILAPIPEPASLMMLVTGALGLVGWGRRRSLS